MRLPNASARRTERRGRGQRPAALALAGVLLAGLPTGRAAAADLAFVTSQNADRLSIVDLGGPRVLASVAVPGKPAPVVYDPPRHRALVVSAETGRLTVVDEAGRVTGGADLGAGAFGVAVGADGSVFVTDWDKGRLTRLDAALRIVWQADTGRAPAGVAVSEDGALVATADRDDDRVSLFDTASGAHIASVLVGAHPYALAWHGGRLFSVNVMGNDISVIDPTRRTVVAVVPTGSHPYGIAFAGGRGFVTDQYDGTVTAFDAATLKPLGTVDTGDYPEGIAPLPDGSGVVVTNWDSDTMTVVDAASLRVTDELALPAGPRAFGAFTGRSVPDR